FCANAERPGMHGRLRRDACGAAIETCHDRGARLEVVIRFAAIGVGNVMRLRISWIPFVLVVTVNVSAQQIQFVEEEIVAKGTHSIKRWPVSERRHFAVDRRLILVLGPSIHHHGYAAVGTEPVVSVGPYIFGALLRGPKNLAAVCVEPIGYL